MKTIKINPQDPLSRAVRQANKSGWYILAFGLVITLVGWMIFSSVLHTFGLLGLLPSVIGVIIMLPGIGLIIWGIKMIRFKIK